jgi:phosphoribosyl-ATP pyrophosphohydrolase
VTDKQDKARVRAEEEAEILAAQAEQEREQIEQEYRDLARYTMVYFNALLTFGAKRRDIMICMLGFLNEEIKQVHDRRRERLEDE